MTRAGKCQRTFRRIENAIDHTDKHVLADVREKIAVHSTEHQRRRGIGQGNGAQQAPAHRHKETRRNAFS